MNNTDIQLLIEKVENQKKELSLFPLNNELKENTYPRHDFDLDEEFDAIRSIN